MLFWVTASLLTIGAILSVLVPIARRSPDREPPSSHDLEVYRDQLSELDRDAARGLIGTAEAEEARAEIARRILKIAGDATRPDGGGAPGFRAARAVGFAAVLSVPLVSWGLYAALGSPDMPSQPLAARLAVDPAKQPVDQLIARAEAHLQQFPDDGRGWDVLAPVYIRMGRYDDCIVAYQQGDQAARRDRDPRIRVGRSRSPLLPAAGSLRMRRLLSSARSNSSRSIRNRSSSWPARWRRPAVSKMRRMPGTPCAPACRTARRGWR